ncbi:MAG: WecB/TagA/CpsF family glycosyltransferase [Candidatus Pacebacteria bacterium]|jgi:N-acetylglucosaminyldiphosphoundecaprenol N-acetyl-beta-D-mannosaminyltransferase|nr:WecB/TagA/CpsF family glycosyltransferase [Candidatus Paceibacterota bacterium]MBT4004772.1 WecB/TagA/CpsF family glycosyltransferase [Candidatus Paceibacterota bacterium]MBT7184137.1 WecB/TagA/CpsF family glycosyltransferase [Candidatus Paceibacterota bacterium]MBT7310031.1 WecB/TagA/CpsF family glycosyltransferase [Candidatus Paceibacterota bacterium]
MHKSNLKLKDTQLSFFLGSFRSVADYIFKNIGNSLVVLPTSLHDFASVWDESSLGKIYNQIDICTTDGMPLVWSFRFFGKKSTERVYGPDLMAYLLEKSDSNMSHYFLGANPIIEQKLQQYLGLNFPLLNTTSSSFLEKDSAEIKNEKIVLNKIKEVAPNLLWIGIGSPKQVELAVKWKKDLPQTTIICVGAAFDLITHSKPTAPVLVKKIGLEWLFRLILEPKRLGKRYLVRIPLFIIKYIFYR